MTSIVPGSPGADPRQTKVRTGSHTGSRPGPHPHTLASSAAAVAWVAVAICAVAVIVWSFIGVGLNPEMLASKWQNGISVIRQFFPPDRTILRQEWVSTLITIQMAVVGTLLGAIVAFPVSFFAARTTSLVRALSSFIKTLLNIQRAIPVLVYALILTAMVGLGPPAGALAIGAGTFVMLTKLYAEALESLAAGPIEAVRAAGGSTPQVFVYGMLPQVFPNFVATTLYAFEINLQSSFILGFVGAGGIGYDLLNFTRLFQWKSVCTVLLITILVVNVIDFVSYRIRLALS